MELGKLELEKLDLEKPEVALILKDKKSILAFARELRAKMEELAKAAFRRIQELDLDLMSLRSDPQVRLYWEHLCKLHELGLALSKKYSEDPSRLPKELLWFYKPSALVDLYSRLSLSDECPPSESIIES
ncbi:MAG: hypothetical protein QXJ75_03340 [Candidatus Bathyarchaeia archaeon]